LFLSFFAALPLSAATCLSSPSLVIAFASSSSWVPNARGGERKNKAEENREAVPPQESMTIIDELNGMKRGFTVFLFIPMHHRKAMKHQEKEKYS
jgi:hypothetical protein